MKVTYHFRSWNHFSNAAFNPSILCRDKYKISNRRICLTFSGYINPNLEHDILHGMKNKIGVVKFNYIILF